MASARAGQGGCRSSRPRWVRRQCPGGPRLSPRRSRPLGSWTCPSAVCGPVRRPHFGEGVPPCRALGQYRPGRERTPESWAYKMLTVLCARRWLWGLPSWCQRGSGHLAAISGGAVRGTPALELWPSAGGCRPLVPSGRGRVPGPALGFSVPHFRAETGGWACVSESVVALLERLWSRIPHPRRQSLLGESPGLVPRPGVAHSGGQGRAQAGLAGKRLMSRCERDSFSLVRGGR